MRIARERPVPWLRGNQPNVQAPAAVVVDLDDGAEVYARKADEERPIASISKLAAMLVVLDHNLELDGLTTITKTDAQVARGGAPSRLLEGMTLSNRDLLHAAMLGSDNRAVSALGRAVGLNASDFAAAMTAKAQSLGLKHTRFREPTGLSPENVSTPREAVVMLKTALAHPILSTVIHRVEYDAHPVARPTVKYVSTYKPALRSNAQILGGKTGYNDPARYCLVVAARIDGRSYCMAFLGAEGKLTRFGDFGRVADWIVTRKPKAGPPSGSMMASATTPGRSALDASSASGPLLPAPPSTLEPLPFLAPQPGAPTATAVTAAPGSPAPGGI